MAGKSGFRNIDSYAGGDTIEAALDLPIRYIDRSRAYYQALGYGEPYRWAQNTDVPFARLTKPASRSLVALITTAAPFQPDAGDQGPGAAYNAGAKFVEPYSMAIEPAPDLRISHLTYDRKHTTAADINTYFPLQRLKEAAADGPVGQLNDRFYGVPTLRSQRLTRDHHAPEILGMCREDGVEAAILVATCPVCHQTVSLTARHLEANGIPTVVMGCARDIVEYAGVSRFLFTDFPLGNSCGKPGDDESQRGLIEMALGLLERATAPRTTVQSPYRWADDPSWKNDFYSLNLTPEEVAEARAEFDEQKATLKAKLAS
jgi:hypothetical protein